MRGDLSQKQQLVLTLEKTFLKADSEIDFYKQLKREGLEIYLRNDKPNGVKLNRKFRFSTLGFTRNRIKKLDLNLTISQREKELEEIQNQLKQKEQGRER